MSDDLDDEFDIFNVGRTVPQPDPLVVAFFWHNRDDGWEKAMFTKNEECGCCGKSIKVGWLEMECDAIRCAECVPAERT